MNPIRSAACVLALCFLAPAWAVNKCTDANGKVSFQDAPCVGEGEKIDVRPAIQGATPIRPAPSAGKEGAFGASWQRKQYLQTQGVPQAREGRAQSAGMHGAACGGHDAGGPVAAQHPAVGQSVSEGPCSGRRQGQSGV